MAYLRASQLTLVAPAEARRVPADELRLSGLPDGVGQTLTQGIWEAEVVDRPEVTVHATGIDPSYLTAK